MNNVHTGATTDAGTEQFRILNFLQMFENGAMGDVTQPATMRALPLMCKAVVDIRKLNRKFINQLRDRSWKHMDENHLPKIGEEVLIRIEDSHGISVELIEFTENDEHLCDGDDVQWMKLPELN